MNWDNVNIVELVDGLVTLEWCYKLCIKVELMGLNSRNIYLISILIISLITFVLYFEPSEELSLWSSSLFLGSLVNVGHGLLSNQLWLVIHICHEELRGENITMNIVFGWIMCIYMVIVMHS